MKKSLSTLLAVTAAAWSLPLHAQQAPAAPRSAQTTISPRDSSSVLSDATDLASPPDGPAQDSSRPSFFQRNDQRAHVTKPK